MNRTVFNDLFSWVEGQLQELECPSPSKLVLTKLSGDAGFRQYFRLNTDTPLLAVYAPIETEDSAAFVAIAQYLRGQGVLTPKIVAFDLMQGWLLIEDLGARLYWEEIQQAPELADQMYGDAMMTLLRLQQCPVMTIPAANNTDFHTLPTYTQELLRREMALFHEWFVPQLLGYTLSKSDMDLLDTFYLQLEAKALQQPQVWVHRDFHSRNLLYRDGLVPGVIDFQDAVRGPITYDLVSLLRDCYLRWPAQQVQQWALIYGDMAVQAGLMELQSKDVFLSWFDWMGLQRHVKVLGVFARLYLRDGKPSYLNDLPLVIRYLLEVSEQYPELADFSYWFKEKLLPLCELQPWYQDYTTAGDTIVQKEANTPLGVQANHP